MRVLLLAGLVAASCRAPAPGSFVSEERAAATVRELVALGPRMGGTGSGARAADHVAAAFASAGLAAEIVLDSELWCHEEDSWSVEVAPAGADSWRRLASPWPWGFSPAADLVGCLTASGEPACELPAVVLSGSNSRRAKAAAALVDGSTTRDGSYPVVRHLPSGDANPFPVLGLSRTEGLDLRQRLARGEHLHARVRLRSEIRRARPRTVVARLPAREGAPAGHLLFCAHGDSDAGGPGADDNASGVAVVLEIARAWSEAVRSGSLPAPPREVRFAVWGTEIHSTRDYLEACRERGETVLGVVNFDQAGFGSGADQMNVEPDDLPANVPLVRAILAVLARGAGRTGFPPRWATNKSLGGTDSYVFSGSEDFRSASRPSVTIFASAWGEPAEHPRTPGMPGESWSDREMVSVDYDLYYHSAGDTPENTTDREPWNLGWCARAGMLGALEWLAGLDAGGG